MIEMKLMNSKEEVMMEMFWEEPKPLTTSEIGSKLKGKGWNKSTLFNTIKSLLDKNYIRVIGVERSNTQYARQFEASFSKEEYAAVVLTSKGIKRSSLANIALAMSGSLDEDKDADEELIHELEGIIEKLRESSNKI